ncbi:carbohydrate esterase family 8 protein [Aplosporella prunicola CBS 121167]|uniref:Pectinesterase n=1 Tax=Aplosporella prunicola CBS 121167 TaxID=1176127 RepID=A0A6A6BJJ9_9PEZI|nr:carbohydrate esterase family 8 protein [Aplosporella prunicola CBS 121167]KAF2143505.1 carbohydrate esterase family 8 protein [Aplosporella prunicola CBS 121167]
MARLLSLLALAGSALAITSPPTGALTVGSSGTYKTVQEAVDALSTSTTSEQTIFIYAGTYKEQVTLPTLKGKLNIYGYSADDSSYKGNKVTITAGHSQAEGLNNDGAATLRAHTANLAMYNVNVDNSYGEGSQAVAISTYYGEHQAYYGCQFTGYQDTVMAQSGKQYYANSLIQGATDFIFGQEAAAWFENIDLRVLAAGSGYLTANGRLAADSDAYYVINNSNVAAADGNSVKAGAYYLGRPWRQYARVVFQHTALSDVINAEGWHTMSSGSSTMDNVVFGEYKNTGKGASTRGRKYGKQLSAAVDIKTVLGSDYMDWVDKKFL